MSRLPHRLGDGAQPRPVQRGVPVVPVLLRWLRERSTSLCAVDRDALASLLQQRYEMGLAKYGQPLMSDDGRDSARDAAEELLDALCYATAMHLKDPTSRENACDMNAIRTLHTILGELIDADRSAFDE